MTTEIQDPIRRELHQRSLRFDATLDADGLASLWHPEGRFQIGALPAAEGREAIRTFFAGFFARGLFTKLEHEMGRVYELQDALIYEAHAIYTLPDGSTLRTPYTNVVRYRDGLFGDYRVYIDTAPLAQAAA